MKEIKFRYRITSYDNIKYVNDKVKVKDPSKIITKIITLKRLEDALSRNDTNDIFIEKRWGKDVNHYYILSRDMYIGSKDRDGNEEYHKDIVEFCGFRYVIEWDDRRACFYGRQSRNKHTPYTGGIKSAQFFRQCKVIGNIYDNPELLEE